MRSLQSRLAGLYPKVVTTFVAPLPGMSICASGYCSLASIARIRDDLYWASLIGLGDSCTGGVYFAPADGGVATQIASGCADSLTWDAANIYWTFLPSFGPQPGNGTPGLWASALPDGNPILLVDAGYPSGVVRGVDGLFASATIVQPDGGSIAAVVEYPATGASAHVLRTIDFQNDGYLDGPIAVNASHVVWTQSICDGASCPSADDVIAMPLDGGSPKVIGSIPGIISGLAIDEAFAYWTPAARGTPGSTVAPPGTLMKSPLAGGPPVKLADGVRPAGLALDNGYVYWTDVQLPDTSGSIFKMPIGGGFPTTIAGNLPSLSTPIAVDTDYVYFADTVGPNDRSHVQTIYRTCK